MHSKTASPTHAGGVAENRQSSIVIRDAHSLRKRRLWLIAAIFAVGLLASAFADRLSVLRLIRNDHATARALEQCSQLRSPNEQIPSIHRKNPRWIPSNGQRKPLLLRNATLFDGHRFLDSRVDVLFEEGVIRSVEPASSTVRPESRDMDVLDLAGHYVTPGLVDMHSHHGLWPFNSLPATRDVNETPLLGPLTPFVRSIDGFKPYDPAIKIIAGGGVTSSLILPGSSNIIGGQAYVVKNAAVGEPVVDNFLLDRGVPQSQRQRYMKMACGENPKHTYFHTRLGNVWLLRDHLSKARELMDRQDGWCRAVTSTTWYNGPDTQSLAHLGAFPESIEYEATIAMLRGHLNVNIHCYEPEDFERMLSVLHEFGVHPSAFHHALEAWQVPDFLKTQESNITIATFAENAFFKAEAYEANLQAGKILSGYRIPVAYKSDHTGEGNNAQYLLHQAAIAHSFGLPLDEALRSVTSVPARSIKQSHRIGFVRPGYDADIVVWSEHPLAIGTTALQVIIDGVPTLDQAQVLRTTGRAISKAGSSRSPKMRPTLSERFKSEFCRAVSDHNKLVFTGITTVLHDQKSRSGNLTVVVADGQITCVGARHECQSEAAGGALIQLENGYVSPGLIAVSQTLGLVEISGEPSTSDGVVQPASRYEGDDLVDHAKYGIKLRGHSFGRARLGGVTKAITAPLSRGSLLKGVSVGFTTSGKRDVPDGGIWKDDVALHFDVGQSSKSNAIPTISGSISELRRLLSAPSDSQDTLFSRAANGTIPVVVHAVNTDVIRQLIWLKRDLSRTNMVIFGGHGAVHVAAELAASNISVILTGARGAPDTWEKRDALSGPPLTPSPVQILLDAGVLLGIAIAGDSHIHNLASEAGWAARFAGINQTEAIKLVSRNIEDILGLEPSTDLVFWEGNPLTGEGSVVLSIEHHSIGTCWPTEREH